MLKCDTMNALDLEKRSSAVTLSDMEIFVFPELMYSLVLANIMSPRIWRWRDDPWFKNLKRKQPYRRIQRLKQYIMDHYAFNLDLETWGLTTQQRELDRFKAFISPDALAQSNALFGYEGDKYYFDIDIRSHFGLDKYTTDTIPYWKTETVEAMDAFINRPGYTTGAGECVSLAALYAAALFVVAEIPLEDIFLMATPLHSQNFVDLDDGILINNRRLVTKSMWFNGSALSAQARRALENERVTIVSHVDGFIHTLYPEATLKPQSYERFTRKLQTFLRGDLTPEMLGNFLRQSPECGRCFVLRHRIHGADHYVPLDRVFAYEQNSKYRLTDPSRDKLLEEIAQEEFSHHYCPGKIVFNDVEDYLREHTIAHDDPESIAALKQRVRCACLNAEKAIDQIIRFSNVTPRLPDPARHTFVTGQASLDLPVGCDRETAIARITALRGANETIDLAFYAFRDLGQTETLPFLLAAMQRSPMALDAARETGWETFREQVEALPDDSIYEGESRLAQPDEVWNYQRGDGLERIIMLAMAWRELKRDPALRIEIDSGRAVLRDARGDALVALPTGKSPRERNWVLDTLPLR